MKHILPILALTACTTADQTEPNNVLIDMGQIETEADGRCYAKDTAPAVIETVTVQVVVTPEVRDADGTLISPAEVRDESRQNIVRERGDVRFETVCPQNYSVAMVSTLQRALKARGYYSGLITGNLDADTSMAIRRFQRINGPDTPLLALETARTLGVVALSRDVLMAE